MLRSLRELFGYQLLAKDGHIGKVENFLFNDEDWKIRYMIVDTGPWILGRKVLISMMSLNQPVWASETFPVDLTREQVKTSPDADLAKPVSRQYEEKLQQHYHWEEYWKMTTIVPGGRPPFIPTHLFPIDKKTVDEKNIDSHLRSVEELFDYQANAIEGKVGSVTDFIVDDGAWQLRYLVVDISTWLKSEKQILVAVEWINSIEITGREVSIDLTQEAIRFSPSFDPTLPVNRQDEVVIYDYHGRPKYWQVVE